MATCCRSISSPDGVKLTDGGGTGGALGSNVIGPPPVFSGFVRSVVSPMPMMQGAAAVTQSMVPLWVVIVALARRWITAVPDESAGTMGAFERSQSLVLCDWATAALHSAAPTEVPGANPVPVIVTG